VRHLPQRAPDVPSFLLDVDPPKKSRFWPRVALMLTLFVLGVAGWAFFTWVRTGAFPPQVTNVQNQVNQLFTSITGKANDGASHETGGDQHSGAGSGNRSTETPAPPTAAQTAGSAASSASSTPIQKPSAGQPAASQPASDAGSSTPAAVLPISQTSAADSAQTSPSTPQPNDKNPDAAGDQDSASAASGDDAIKKQPPLTIDGFTRKDVPELLRQADAAVARGDTRLARYEYNLILKLAPRNADARDGLRRLDAAEQSH
jgi:hypothetical protein